MCVWASFRKGVRRKGHLKTVTGLQERRHGSRLRRHRIAAVHVGDRCRRTSVHSPQPCEPKTIRPLEPLARTQAETDQRKDSYLKP